MWPGDPMLRLAWGWPSAWAQRSKKWGEASHRDTAQTRGPAQGAEHAGDLGVRVRRQPGTRPRLSGRPQVFTPRGWEADPEFLPVTAGEDLLAGQHESGAPHSLFHFGTFCNQPLCRFESFRKEVFKEFLRKKFRKPSKADAA